MRSYLTTFVLAFLVSLAATPLAARVGRRVGAMDRSKDPPIPRAGGLAIVAGRSVGRWAMVAAGSVVTQDVPDFALVAGTPARQIGWVGRSGRRLVAAGEGRWRCPHTHGYYTEEDGVLLESG